MIVVRHMHTTGAFDSMASGENDANQIIFIIGIKILSSPRALIYGFWENGLV